MRWYQRFFRRGITEKHLDAELRFHLEQQIADYISAGMKPEEARRRARLEFGGLDQVKEECREVGVGHFLETLAQDVRYGLRQLRRGPSFTAVAVITLALGIGANTAIFSAVNAVLFQPLPYKDPARLVKIGETAQFMGGETGVAVSAPDFIDWKKSSRSAEDMAAVLMDDFGVAGGAVPEKIQGARVSTNSFRLLGIEPILGRSFGPEEDQAGRDRAVILSHGAWQQRFGSDPGIIGRTLRLNDQSYVVGGVLPKGFEFSWGYYSQNIHRYEIWIPLALDAGMLTDREFHPLFVVARLRALVNLGQARADMREVAHHLAEQYPATNRVISVQVSSLHDQIVGNVRPALLILLSAVALVLLIACANIANLLLARSIERSKEISIRTAIGASRSRLTRQLLTENFLVAGLGGCFGLLLSVAGTNLLVTIIPPNVPRISAVGIDREVVVFAAIITLLTGAIFGLFPALRVSKPDVTDYLKEGSGTLTSAPGGRRAQNLLVASEVAFALVLLVGGGLLIESFWHLVNTNLGFYPVNLLTAKLVLPDDRYSAGAQVRAFAGQVLDQVRVLPGVRYAAIASPLPLSGMIVRAQYAVDGNPLMAGEGEPEADYSAVSNDYFHTMEIPVSQGRVFIDQDTAQSPPVLIVNSILANQLWPGENPIGKRLTVFSPAGEVSRTVVGVVGKIKYQGLEEAAGPQMYVPYSQDPTNTLYLVIRTASKPEVIARGVRFRVLGLDRNLPVEDMMTMQQRLASLGVLPRFYTSVLGSFAALALILAAVGVYGVMSHVAAQRTHEVGIRFALGASREDILKLVVGQGLRPTLIGVVIGVGGALILTRSLSSLLYGVKPTDPLTFVVVSVILTAVALLASYIPARRATKVDPMVALRYE